MDDKLNKPRQLELFSHSADSKESEKSIRTFFHNRIHLNVEHIIVLFVVLLMALIFSFSLGVERGKKLSNFRDEVITYVEKQEPKEPAPVIEVKEEPQEEVVLPRQEIFEYTIQVASFKNQAAVEEESRRLERKGYETMIIPKGNWIILCVGKFNSKQEAKGLWQELRKKYGDCIIRKI